MIFLKPRIHICNHVLVFFTLVIFIVALRASMRVFTFGHSSSPMNSFPMLLINSYFLLCSLDCHILIQSCFAFFISGS